MKSILRHVLQTYNLPKLLAKTQLRYGAMLATIVAVTSETVKVEPGGGRAPMSANRSPSRPVSASKQDASIVDEGEQGNKPAMLQRQFNLLNSSPQDRELRAELENTVLQMLGPQSVTNA